MVVEKRSYIVVAEDEYDRKEELDILVEKIFSGKPPENAVLRYSLNELTPEVLASLKTLPFFVERQLAIVYGFEKAKKKHLELLNYYIDGQNLATYMILECESIPGTSKELKAIKSKSQVIQKKKQYESELKSFFFSYTKQKGIKLDKEATALLIERSGTSKSFMRNVLDKLAFSLAGKDFITEEDVNLLVEEHNYYDGYKLTNYVAARNLSKTLEVYNFLIGDGSSVIELIGILCWHFRRYLEAKISLAEGVPNSQIAEKLRIHPKFSRKFFDELRSFSKNEISTIFSELLKIDASAKIGQSEVQKELEVLLLRICSRQLV